MLRPTALCCNLLQVYMCRSSRNSQPHLFHRACHQALPREERSCPHCGSRRAPLPVQLKITMAKTPLRFLQVQSRTMFCPLD